MSSPVAKPSFLSAEQLMEKSFRHPVVVTTMDPLEATYHTSDRAALQFLADVRPPTDATIQVPLATPMFGVYRSEGEPIGDRPSDDFRVLMADREITVRGNECVAVPDMLFNGITSLALRVEGEPDVFDRRSVWINVNDPGVRQLHTGFDAVLQTVLWSNTLPFDELAKKYERLKTQAGQIFERVVALGW